MKKLMIAAAIVCAAVASQAASFNWTTDQAYGVDLDEVEGNGTFAASDLKADRLDKCTLTYVLQIYNAGTLVGSAAGDVETTTKGAISVADIEIAQALASTTYDYVLTMTGTQNSLTSLQSADWDYSKATITTTLEGEVTTAGFGATDLSTDTPSSWTVSGATPAATPEPTSAMLMLLGVAGLALKRKRA